MIKPLHENLKDARIESDGGDLLPVLEYAGIKLSELVLAVNNTGKGGSFTLKVFVKPSAAGANAVRCEVTAKMPKGLPAESLLWPTPEGNFLNQDPRQGNLDLKDVQDDPPRQLKSVA
ncbi:MAG: hypothetical protein JNM98_21735 [Rhodocyclaceae bacterium]|nr:hypothetical protein [Rhodocyclaceae bacterium]